MRNHKRNLNHFITEIFLLPKDFLSTLKLSHNSWANNKLLNFETEMRKQNIYNTLWEKYFVIEKWIWNKENNKQQGYYVRTFTFFQKILKMYLLNEKNRHCFVNKIVVLYDMSVRNISRLNGKYLKFDQSRVSRVNFNEFYKTLLFEILTPSRMKIVLVDCQ
jgi:hypothetical protein